MALHNLLGKAGEKLAEEFLLANGYEILIKNWRFRRYEIDIIAFRNGILHFIEVKTLNESAVSFPEQSVNRKKFKKILIAADGYLFQHPEYRLVQYDILAISMNRAGYPQYLLIEDVYL